MGGIRGGGSKTACLEMWTFFQQQGGRGETKEAKSTKRHLLDFFARCSLFLWAVRPRFMATKQQRRASSLSVIPNSFSPMSLDWLLLLLQLTIPSAGLSHGRCCFSQLPLPMLVRSCQLKLPSVAIVLARTHPSTCPAPVLCLRSRPRRLLVSRKACCAPVLLSPVARPRLHHPHTYI